MIKPGAEIDHRYRVSPKIEESFEIGLSGSGGKSSSSQDLSNVADLDRVPGIGQGKNREFDRHEDPRAEIAMRNKRSHFRDKGYQRECAFSPEVCREFTLSAISVFPQGQESWQFQPAFRSGHSTAAGVVGTHSIRTDA